jgi:hypothetical protein
MSQEIITRENENQWSKLNNSIVNVEASRAVAETKAAIQMAKLDRRNVITIERYIEEMCKRQGLAETSQYAYPKGNTIVTGASIRLAEALAQVYGNLDYGIVEIENRGNESIMMAYCHDLETNVKVKRIFSVKHEIDTKEGTKKLKSQRDIYELTANFGARRLRACILSIIPSDLVEKALKLCDETLKKGNGVPLKDRITNMVKAFESIGVTQEMLENRLGHRIDTCIEYELVSMRKLYQSIVDGMATVEEIFGAKETTTNAKSLSEITTKKKSSKKEKQEQVEQNEQVTEKESVTMEDLL